MEEFKEVVETVNKGVSAKLEEATKDMARESEVAERLEAVKVKLEGIATNKIELDSIKVLIDELSVKLEAQKEVSKKEDGLSSLEKHLENSKSEIDRVHKDGIHFKSEYAIKNFSIGSNLGGITNGAPFIPIDYKDFMSRTPDVRERFNILNYITVGTTNGQTVSWMEESTETGSALFIDECVAKPVVSKEWVRKQATVQKVADFAKICDEVLLYLPRMRQEIERFLRKLVNITLQEAILSGDGTGNNLLGIIPQATSFVAGAKADSVKFANHADAIRASVSQIKCLGYMPDCVFVNCDDMFAFESIKDANGQYLRAPLGGVQLVECPFITPGEFLVGDCSMAHADFFRGITTDFGRNGEDFRENAVSVRSELFVATYIPSNNVNAFIYDTFDNVITLIDKA